MPQSSTGQVSSCTWTPSSWITPLRAGCLPDREGSRQVLCSDADPAPARPRQAASARVGVARDAPLGRPEGLPVAAVDGALDVLVAHVGAGTTIGRVVAVAAGRLVVAVTQLHLVIARAAADLIIT